MKAGVFLLILMFLFFASFSATLANNIAVSGDSFDDINNAISAANSGDVIQLGSNTFKSNGSVIRVTTENLTFIGASPNNPATVSGENISRIFLINATTTTFKYINFVNGNGNGTMGTAILTYSKITVDNCTFSNNIGESGSTILIGPLAYNSIIKNSIFNNNKGIQADTDNFIQGGVIRSATTNLTITDSTFTNNFALNEGGAISIVNGTGTKIINCKFTNNSANIGGAIRIADCEVTISNSLFNQNNANNIGAIYILNGAVTILNSNFTSNKANNGGAIGIYNRTTNDNKIIILKNLIFDSNKATGMGGAIYTLIPIKYLNDSIFKNNSAINGGGIYSLSNLQINTANFSHNTATTSGGAIYANGQISISSKSNFTSNNANNGGAIYAFKDLNISNSIFSKNNAISNGGALYLNGGTTRILSNSNFSSNNGVNGGAIYSNGVLSIASANFNDNFVSGSGGAIYSLKNLQISSSKFNGNNASANGGAIYSNNQGSINISNSYFNGNNAANGGALYLESKSYIISSNFVNNKVNSGNSVVYLKNAILVQNSNFTSNIGICLELNGDGAVISHNRFINTSGNGVYSSNLKNGIIIDNVLLNNIDTALYIIGNGNKAHNNSFNYNNVAVILNGNNTEFINNNIINSQNDGLRLTGNNLKFISNNISDNHGYGLILNGNNPTITNNLFKSNNNALYGQTVSNATISTNSLLNNLGNGLYILGDNNKIYKNMISNNKNYGIYLKGKNNQIYANNISNNLEGLHISGSNNNIYNNTLTSNNLGILILGNNFSIQNNLIYKTKTRGISINGNNSKIANNRILNGDGNGIYIKGANNEIFKTNSSNNKGRGIYIEGNNNKLTNITTYNNKATGIYLKGKNNQISKSNSSNNNGIGIYIEGKNNKISNTTVNNNKATGIYLKGNENQIIENEITHNNGKGIDTNGNKLIISYNIIHRNLKNGILGFSSGSLIKANLVYNNSNKKQLKSAIYFKGNNNKFYYNIIQNNGFHGLYIVGNKNIIKRTLLYYNKHTQIIIQGNKNDIAYVNIHKGKKSGLKLTGNSNKITDIQVTDNKNKGIIINGNKNKLFKVLISNNTVGLHIKGNYNYLLQSIISSNKGYGIFNEKGIKNHYNYNYIVNNKAKYNFYRAKGTVNADYNWWGKNNIKTVKNLKIKKYVTAKLNAPNILKIKKKYTVTVIFRSNTNKKLKKRIPNLIVLFEFKGGKISPKHRTATKNIAKVKIKPTKHKTIAIVAQVDNQLLYKQYVSFNGKLYEHSLYVKIMLEKIRRYNEWVRQQNEKMKDYQKLKMASDNIFKSTSLNYYYSISAMGQDFAKSSSLKIIPPKLLPPITYKPGTGLVSPNSNWLKGMIDRNMPNGTVTKGLFNIATKLMILNPKYYISLYIIGKVVDALTYANGNPSKFLEYSFINVYGYSNLDKYGWGGEAGKHILEFTLGIDETGNMSFGDLALNMVSLALGFGLGGIAAKGTKGLAKTILKKLPKSLVKKATPIVDKFVQTVKKYTNVDLRAIDFSQIRKSIVNVAKIATGDFSPIYKKIPVPSKLKPADQLLKEFEKFTKNSKTIAKLAKGDVKEALKLLNSNLKNIAILIEDAKIKAFLNGLASTAAYKADLILLTKAISEGPAKIKEANKAIEKGVKNADANAIKLIKKYTKNIKALEKLLKLYGLK
ncbi:beta strand repeat-containing protein [Methanobrevibacter curvatus]|uniref:beta strand repeat-containing protein n=1 Tax=Methanobrevibacter curvatus TaxID=49547 RepID=UPI00147174E0|nr:right-handed parallel beta-helix repeat-containing protein [Methanobrevibacter curvatus]